MKIFGFNFTNAPNRQKPIICTVCELSEPNTLQVDRILKIASLNEFEVFLKRRGPWVAGFNFPFGQPQQLIKALNWPENWSDYVDQIAVMSRQEFIDMLDNYSHSQPEGDKQHLRGTDVKTKASSPMKIQADNPLGKRFFRGSPRLLRSDIAILPCRPRDDNRIALESNPALVARKWLGQESYKSDDPALQTVAQQTARANLLNTLHSPQLQERYGLTLEMSQALTDQMQFSFTADSLDALLCAIQAAWACNQPNYGIPTACDPLEGWVVDPDMG